HLVPVPVQLPATYRHSVYGCAPAAGGAVPLLSFVHHVTVDATPPAPFGALHQLPSVIVIDDAGYPLGVLIALAQWISRRSLSSARRAACCAWPRCVWSVWACVAPTNSCVSPASTTARIARTTSISASVKPCCAAPRRLSRAQARPPYAGAARRIRA